MGNNQFAQEWLGDYKPVQEWLGDYKPVQDDRVIIAGCRSFYDYDLFSYVVLTILGRKGIVHPLIISGGAQGTDHLAEVFAKRNGYDICVIPARWKVFGKSAGYIRNEELAKCSLIGADQFLIAFWDGESPGTKSMIDIARKHNIATEVFNISTPTHKVTGGDSNG